MSQPPTVEGLLERLKRKGLEKEADDLKNGKTTFDEMVKRTEEQWKDTAKRKLGDEDLGIDIYNYLHPQPQQLQLQQLEQQLQQLQLQQVTPIPAQINMNTPSFGNPLALDGIDPEQPHFDRTNLLETLSASVKRYVYTLITSSSASGKTSLIRLYTYAVRKICNVSYISCNNNTTLDKLLMDVTGIDLNKLKYRSPFTNNLPHLVILDDAQRKYNENSNWEVLIKAMPQELKNCRVIISAVYTLKPGSASPAVFGGLSRLERKDFLLSEQESHAFLSIERCGLDEKFAQFSVLKNAIVKECGGLIGALALCCNEINFHFLKSVNPQEGDALKYFFSEDITKSMQRCFGSGHSRPVSDEVKDFLSKLFVSGQDTVSIEDLEKEDEPTVSTLLKAGILVNLDGRNAAFSSRMAQRYYFDLLFPGRAKENPRPIGKLVETVISDLPYQILRNSVQAGDFPKEATFQHLFMVSLARCTKPSVQIHPELSRVLGTGETIRGEIDFYLDSELKWGIELLVKGDRISEHMDRFGAGGKYAALGVSDYAVIDFREAVNGKPTNVQRREKRYTAFFDPKDFSRCSLYSGPENVTVLNLSR